MKPKREPKPSEEAIAKASADAEVTEAGIESFPASDPPAFNLADPRDKKRKRAPNTTQLRDTMPSARTIGKSSAEEPSAAPFDTDDEAAGCPPPPDAVRSAITHEGELSSHTAERQRSIRLPTSVLIATAVLLAIVVLALALT